MGFGGAFEDRSAARLFGRLHPLDWSSSVAVAIGYVLDVVKEICQSAL